jgi:hypothetical protein
MKDRVNKEKAKRIVTKSSMSNASKPICQEEECIGKVTVTNREGDSGRRKDEKVNRTNATRSSMKIGKKRVCRDKECIGET